MAEQLKDVYSPEFIKRLATDIHQVCPDFCQQSFIERVMDESWPELALKARMTRIRESLHAQLQRPFDQAVPVLLKVAPNYGSYEAMFFPDYISAYGLEHWELSMVALEELTKCSSSEFAVRPFIEQDSVRMMAQMQQWSQSDNYHVRRLASEGCRPRLPWASALNDFKKDPSAILPIINALRADESDYVHRSVANNLNDIAKDHPNVVIEWVTQHQGECAVTDWVIKHASRTLLKQANPNIMAFYGYTQVDHLKLQGFCLKQQSVEIGQDLDFEFTLAADHQSDVGLVRVEYVVEYLKANGKHQQKVFKLSEGNVRQASVSFQRKQSFRQMSTRKHYPGEHFVAIRVNGSVLGRLCFEVVGASI